MRARTMDWSSIGNAVASAAIIYLFVIGALRIAGSRALAKMSAYDLIGTVALGSLVANVALQDQLGVIRGAAVILTFLVIQHALSWILERWPPSRLVLKS